MRIPALAVALLLVLSGVVPATAAAVGTESGALRVEETGSAPSPQVDGPFDGDPQTVVRIDLRDNGNAKWRVEMHYRFDSPNESDAFRRLGEEYVDGNADVGVRGELFERIASRTSEATGRDMEIRNATYDYSLDGEAGTGTLTVEFVWTNFLRQMEDGNLALGDAFRLPSESSGEPHSWLSLLGEDQRLYVETPPGYATDTTSIEVLQRNNALILDGPSTFEGEDALVVTYRPTNITDPGGIPWDLVVGGGILVAFLIALAAVVLRWQSDSGAGAGSGRPGDPTPEAGGGTTNGGVDAAESVTAGETGTESMSDDEDAAEAAEPEVDLSLLSDEERIERLLERNGGRMKQATIVAETDWSDAKVSQLLSAMAEEGRVDKLRLGRENLISVPDETDDDGNGNRSGNGNEE
ncbi:hypothetical protein C474_11621 [Halogeometricum pallidum JCM 14848]|uniref:Transmembrane glycoprotein / HTH domain protein n=1 Tax=Halogeometricum pallidum JCM 14848 TaxID=1227487 RepID=M0D8H8_HALPD|nr:hypothetical protein [Halogeometricum pallidum]ELZ30459.1 hypothetical protein C474_11621 [Halogeometricum pallidum JCM 14848]